MTPLKLRRHFYSGDGAGCSWLLAGVPFLLAVIGCALPGLPTFSLWGTNVLLILGLGLMLAGAVWGALEHVSRFRSPSAATKEETIRPGEPFHFTFKIDFNSAVRLESVGVFFVLRELVTFNPVGSDDEYEDFDRLVDGGLQEGQVYAVGQPLSLSRDFRLPKRAMGLRHPYPKERTKSVQTSWIIKIRLDWGNDRFEWWEYELPVAIDEVMSQESDDETVEQSLFDLFFQGERPGSIMSLAKAWPQFLPHGIRGIFCSPRGQDVLLLERRGLAELKELKANLEAAGAILEIRSSG
ncbi:hypothetical protein EON80_15395 [bacterium]|nr:MAG: hypothetical protein EON80_15395 [bacterium]